MNPVIGDAALEAAFSSPSAWSSLSEQDLVACHLRHALATLQRRSAAATQTEGAANPLSPPPVLSRNQALQVLLQYIESGRFPRHEDPAAALRRLPCFVDSSGVPCAVAHLMQASGSTGALLASSIASSPNLKHATVASIAGDLALGPKVLAWATGCGLTLDDLALVQPTYEFVARKAAAKLNAILGKLKSAVEKQQDIGPEEVQGLAHDSLVFGDTMQSGFGYPQKLIPGMVAALEQLEALVAGLHLPRVSSLIVVLRKEALGNPRPQPEDYKGLLEL